MAKACLSCGTVNPSNAKFCSKCGKPLSSKTGGGKRIPCKKCGGKLRLITGGPFTVKVEPDGPINQYWEVWEYYILECNHKYFTRKTGEEPWEP